MRPRTYYRGPDAVVTDQHFVWRTRPAREFAVRDLRNVRLLRREVNPLHRYAVRAGAGILVLVSIAWMVLDPPAVYAIGLFVIAAPLTVASTLWRGPAGPWEMRATYRGRPVVVYACRDTRVFNQVVRALRRAKEAVRPLVAS